MSLIETAVKKAKMLGETGRRKLVDPIAAAESAAPPVSPPPRRRKQLQLDEQAVAERAASARVLPSARVDADAMERNGVLPQVTDSATHRAYRILRTRVQQRMQAEGWHSMAVTAAGAGEGKTLTALNLAISLARDISTWVCLVDFDLQRPRVATYLGLEFDKGLSDYIAGEADFEEILYNPGIERLCVIPNRQPIEYSSDVLATPRIRQLCDCINAEQPKPVVIFDMPPLLLSDDVIKFSPNVDSTLFVASEGGSSRVSMQRAHEVLQDMNLVGVVLNRAAERVEGGYY